MEAAEPSLFAYASQVESGEAWKPPKPPPAFRYRSLADSSGVDQQVRDSLKLPSLVKARKDDTQCAVLVEALHAERLERETQKLLDSTPGLHRDIARHAVLDANPEFADSIAEGDRLAGAQSEIKRRIKDMQTKEPKLSFRDAWERLQKSDPQLFEPLPSA
jgi:hypothetical protein